MKQDTTDYNLKAFKAIVLFTSELSRCFCDEIYKPMRLYNRLLTKVSITNEETIQKHLDIFRNFCKDYSEHIYNKTLNTVCACIKYTDKVYIDMRPLFTDDKEQNDIIYKHLLTISALLDSGSNAKNILKQMNNEVKEEADFLGKIIDTVENNIDINQTTVDPMTAISSLMSSGVFSSLMTEMTENMYDGNLDISKLINTVQTMCSSLGSNQPSKMSETQPRKTL